MAVASVPGTGVVDEVDDRLATPVGQAPVDAPVGDVPSDRLARTVTEAGGPPDPVESATLRPRLSIESGGLVARDGDGIRVVIDGSLGQAEGSSETSVVQRRARDGRWVTIAAPVGADRPTVSLAPGRRYAFRSTPQAGVGAAGDAWELRTRIDLRDSDSPRLETTAAPRSRQRDAVGGSVLGIGEGSAIRTTFTGRAFALVGLVEPSSGVLMVRVDEEPWRAEDLSAPARSARRVVLSQDLEHGQHTLEVGAADGTVALDAVADPALRPLGPTPLGVRGPAHAGARSDV